MSMFRYALGRLFGGVLALTLFALLLNASILSWQQVTDSRAAQGGPPPVAVALGDLPAPARRAEVTVRARIDAALDVAVPDGAARLFLLSDPQARPDAPAKAAIFIAPADYPAFEALLAQAAQHTAAPKPTEPPVIEVNGIVAMPYWIDRAEAAAQAMDRDLAPDIVFIKPFLHGRIAGLAPSLLAYLVPSLLAALIVALLWSEAQLIVARHRGLRALDGLQSLDRQTEETAANVLTLQPGDDRWAEIITRRDTMRRERVRLEAQLQRGVRASGTGLRWLVAMAMAGMAGMVPQRPLVDALAAHLIGAQPDLARTLHAGAALQASLDAMALWPGEAVAALMIGLFGPQSLGLSEQMRSLPFTVWAALAAILLVGLARRGDTRRSQRGGLR